MKAISAPLLALFNSSSQFAKADLYTWTFNDGTVLRVTDADIALTFGGVTWASCTPAFSRSKTTVRVGLTVDSVDIVATPAPSNTIGGLSWQAAAVQGYLDGARVLIETAYLSTWPTVVGKMYVFQGQVSDILPDRTSVSITVKDALELLTQNFPRNVYQAVCSHTVYDPGCGVSKASFTSTGTVASSPAPTRNSVKTSNAQAAGYFAQGVITFTSGANAGLKRTVKSYDPSTGFTFALPLPVAPVAGDTISVFAGCDKTLATCRAKFSNDGKFRGFPWVPTPEQATPAVVGGTTQRGK